jgi:hypothetical protein
MAKPTPPRSTGPTPAATPGRTIPTPDGATQAQSGPARPEARATAPMRAVSSAATLGGIDPLMELKPGSEDIRRRAYERFLARQASGLPGSPDDDWFQAERDLNARS